MGLSGLGKMPSHMEQPLILRADVVVTNLEHETILLDLESKYFYSLNPAGWVIVELFEDGATRARVEEICSQQVGEEGMGQVRPFLDELIGERLVEPSDETSVGPLSELSGSAEGPTLEKHREPLQKIMISAFDPTLPLAE